MVSLVRVGAISIALATLVVLASQAEARTIRVDRQWERIEGEVLADDGFVERDIFSVAEVPPDGAYEQRPFSISFFGTVYDSSSRSISSARFTTAFTSTRTA
jgi:hypothetical protein